MYVDDGGRLGLGTSTPVVDVHIKSGNTPTLRLEQDGSSGFTPQTWDVAGNEANFFIRDATNGSTLPFRIFPGAPSNALNIEASGDIGLGDTSPDASLEVERSDATAKILVTETNSTVTSRTLLEVNNNGPVRIGLTNADANVTWFNRINGAGDFALSEQSTGVDEFVLTSAGNLTITGGLITTQGGGVCTAVDPCDGVFQPTFAVESIDEHAVFMWENSYLKGVGPTKPNGPINITQKTGGLINELEKAHIYIERLNEKLKDKASQVEELAERLARLEALVVANEH